MALPPDVRQRFVEWGRQGGQQGGKKRASRLTKARRTAIAKAAAKARWKGHTPKIKRKRRTKSQPPKATPP